METLKDKIIILFASLWFLGCSNHNTKEVEKLANFKLSNKVTFEKKDENWNNFNGEGYKILVYDILDISYFTDHLNNNNNFEKIDFTEVDNPFSKSAIMPYVKNGKGYYHYLLKDQEEKVLVIDLVNKKMIYYYNSM